MHPGAFFGFIGFGALMIFIGLIQGVFPSILVGALIIAIPFGINRLKIEWDLAKMRRLDTKLKPAEPPALEHTFPRRLTDIHVSYHIRDLPHVRCISQGEHPYFETRAVPHLSIQVQMPDDYVATARKLGLDRYVITDYEEAEPNEMQRNLMGYPPTRKEPIHFSRLLAGVDIPRQHLQEINQLVSEIKGKLTWIKQQIEQAPDTATKDSFDI